VIIAFCYYYLKDNFIDKFGRALAPYFWKVARAKTRVVYNTTLVKLCTMKPKVASYLEATLSKT